MTSLAHKALTSIGSEFVQQDFYEHFVHNNHPLFGIQPQRCTQQLTHENWQGSGLFNPTTKSYVYLNKAISIQKNNRYTCVNCYCSHAKTSEHFFFSSEIDALQFANKIHHQALG